MKNTIIHIAAVATELAGTDAGAVADAFSDAVVRAVRELVPTAFEAEEVLS